MSNKTLIDRLDELVTEAEAEAERANIALAALKAAREAISPKVKVTITADTGEAERELKRVKAALKKRARKRAPKGQREGQLLRSIKEHPERRVSEHARSIGISPQQAYPLLDRLQKANRVTRIKRHGKATYEYNANPTRSKA